MRLHQESLALEVSDNGRGFLFDRETGEIFALNRTASLIVELLLSSDCKVPDLAHALMERFGITEKAAEQDVVEFLESLRRYDLGEE